MTPHTSDLKQQIERVLRWEQSSHWRTRDFAHLSDLVFRHTQQRVDAHSLQNFWQSSVVPSPDFLDTLARFVDYEDWDDFCTRNFYGVVEADDETELTPRAHVGNSHSVGSRYLLVLRYCIGHRCPSVSVETVRNGLP